MKRLMIAGIAGLCAAVSFGLESANIVGYQNKEVADGFKLVGSIFADVSDTDSAIAIDSIKPTGYETNEDLIDAGGTWGDMQIILLNQAGGNDASYDWEQEYDGEWLEGAWVGAEGETLAPGQGIWYYCNVYSEGMGLQFAGEVLVDARDVPLKDGFAAISIPLGRPVELSEITPAGYESNEELIDAGGTWGDMQIIVLDQNGGNAESFDWEQEYDGEWLEGAWVGDYTFQPGDAIWAYCNVWEEGCKLQFPGLED